MILRYAEIQLGIANQREASFGDYLCRLAVFGGYIFKEELLLVHGCRGKQGCFDTLAEPQRGDVAGIARFSYGLDLMTDSLCLTIADGDIGLDNLTSSST